jgi:protein-S-isoprenylcysteine O-methyltransferase Ste14
VADVTRRLARLRVPLGFVFAAAVFWRATPTPVLLAWGTVIAGLGEGLRIWAAGHLNKSREVTSSGPYRYFAHPLYVGSATMGAGLAIASGSLVVGVLIALYLGATITAAIRSEERFLRGKFGDDYEAYRRGAARSAAAAAEATRPFSVQQAMANREYRALAGLLAAVLLLLLKATL